MADNLLTLLSSFKEKLREELWSLSRLHDNGKPVVTRGRKASALLSVRVERLPNGVET